MSPTKDWGNRTQAIKRAARRARLENGTATPVDNLPAHIGLMTVAQLAAAPNPRAVGEYLLQQGAVDFCNVILDLMRRGNRTGIRYFAQATQITGVQRDLLMTMLLKVGFQTEEEFDLAARVHRSISGLSDRDREDLATRTLQSAMKRDPEARERIVLKLMLDPAKEV